MLIYPTADPASQAPRLGPDDIHLWVASMELPEAQVAELARLLDPDEASRAARFRFDVHRRRFTVGRGFQRRVLGAYLGRSPASLVYELGPKGKPNLASGQSSSPLYFNLSNSEELAILGITRRSEIGVDVEHLRELSDLEALAERFFSISESRTLLAQPAARHIETFFNCWTRKEAYLKAVGTGLSAPLDRFDVTLVPGEEPRMLALEGDAARAASWNFIHLVPAVGYLGAIAIEASGLALSSWSWELPLKVYFSSLGCKLNLAEAEGWARSFASAGYQVVGELDRAELHVINSCTVTHRAAQQSRQRARLGSRRGSGVATVLAGCYPSAEPAEAARLSGVDLVVENRDKEALLERVRARFPPREEPLPYLALPPSHARATVKIGDGCDLRCAFCIIPTTRGRQRSRSRSEVVEEVEALVANGFREVVLTGVQISDYQDGETTLFELATAVLESTAIERLRLTSIAPWGFDERLLELFSSPRVCRHVHLSLQSGCSSTLRRMRRPYSAEAYATLRQRFASAVPGLAVTTDVIVGFPGETEPEFEESLAFVGEQGFAKVHAFPFSSRPGTAAASMPDQIPPDIKRERMARLTAAADVSTQAFAERHLGQQVEVLWETQRQGLWQGLTDNYLRVWAALEGERRSTLSGVEVVGVREGGAVGGVCGTG